MANKKKSNEEKNMKTKLALILILIIMAGIWLTLIINTYHHEMAHKAFMENDGCKKVKVEINYFTGSGYAQCLDTNYVETQDAKMYHSMNEIVTYNNKTTCFVVGLFGFFIMVLWLQKS